MDADNYRFRVLKPLAEGLGIEKLNFQILRRTMATLAQRMGSVKDIQAHLRHSRPDTTAREYMQALPESVQQMVGSVYLMLMKGGEEKERILNLPQNATNFSEDAVAKLLILWWAQQDSNLRLPPCEGGTLPLSYAPMDLPRS